MRILLILALSGALGAIGCDSSEGAAGTGGSGGTAGTGGSAGTGGVGGGGGSAGAGGGGAGGVGGIGGGEAPVITMVQWAPDGACEAGVVSDYSVTVTATDADSAPADLIYNGSVTGCTGPIDMETSTVACPNAAPYNGSVVVEDDNGNVSNSVNFTIGICETSSTTP